MTYWTVKCEGCRSTWTGISQVGLSNVSALGCPYCDDWSPSDGLLSSAIEGGAR